MVLRTLQCYQYADGKLNAEPSREAELAARVRCRKSHPYPKHSKGVRTHESFPEKLLSSEEGEISR